MSSATRLLGKAAKPGSTEAGAHARKAGLRQDADHDLLTRCPLRNSVVNQCLLTSYPDPSNCCCASRSGLVVSSQRIGVGPWNHIRRSTHSAATPGEEKDLEIGWPVLAKVGFGKSLSTFVARSPLSCWNRTKRATLLREHALRNKCRRRINVPLRQAAGSGIGNAT